MKDHPVPIDGANLTLKELEKLAEGIRQVVVGIRGLTINDYIKRVSTIDPSELGYIKVKAICNEPKLEAYFPDEVFRTLRERLIGLNIENLNDYDKRFIIQNREKGYEWLSKYMYTPVDMLKKIFRHNEISISKRNHYYTPEQIEFIKKNADKGVAWLSKSLGISKASIHNKVGRIGIVLGNPNPIKAFTQEENQFIIDNASKGTKWIASQLARTIDSIRGHARHIKVKIDFIHKGQKRHKFTAEEDQFIREHSHKGIMWLSKKMGLPYESVSQRAYIKKIKIRRILRKYRDKEMKFIRGNIDKGLEYLADKFKVSRKSIQLKLKRMGITLNEENRDTGRELQSADEGTCTASQVCSL